MLSSYLTIVPKEEMPIDMEKLNEAILGERGYYDMLLKTEIERKSVLRFNLQAFKNNYNLVDLSKMKLTYFGIKVGTCGENHLSIDKEFDFQPAEDKTTAEEIVEGEKSAAEEEKELVNKWNLARKNKDFDTADTLRQEIVNRGIVL